MTLYLLFITIATFLLYWVDKRAAMYGYWRIPEHTLLMCGLAGGTIGAFAAMRVLRHKTSKPLFQLKFWLVTALQALVLVFKPELITDAIRAVLG